MTSIADPRAPHSPVRRTGPNLEKWGWIYMRASGVLLVVLIFGHLFVNLMVGEGIHGIDFAFVAGKYASPFWQWWDVLMLWLALIHGANGMRTIIERLHHPPAASRVCSSGPSGWPRRSSSFSAHWWSSPSTPASASRTARPSG